MLKTDRCRVVGAMSGTSLDGIDAAEIVTDGHDIFEFGPSAFRPYSDSERSQLQAALGKWPEDDISQTCELIETLHIEVLSKFGDSELVGFHGQTLAHDPKGHLGQPRTHQAGDGAVLANALEKPVVWDFRSADVQLGGEGAPLAPFYHFALAKYLKADAPLAILNLGGVGNLTWIDPAMPLPETQGALLAFDTGPANAPINDMMHARLGKSFDENGEIAAKGCVEKQIIEDFLDHSYFSRMAPKSLDRDAFSKLLSAVEHLSTQDAVATLTMACAASVAEGLKQCPRPPERLLVTGGGRLNPTLMKMLASASGVGIAPIETVGLDGDMLEAQAFAYLAVRVAKGLATSAPGTTGVMSSVAGGAVSVPNL